MIVAALEFPPVNHLIDWPEFIGGSSFGINKPILINFVAVVLTLLLFFFALRNKSLVPSGVRNIVESAINFLEESVIMQTIGPDGLRYLPFLAAIFFFVLFSNIFEVVPFIQFPANARMAMPIFLAILVWFVFNFLGFKHHGLGYVKGVLFPPGVPKALYVLVTPIEFVSTFLVRPFSLAVRLFANMLAGHLLLVTFAVLTATLASADGILKILTPLPAIVLVGLTGFEILVAFLQAFIFTILTAVYIGGAVHPEH